MVTARAEWPELRKRELLDGVRGRDWSCRAPEVFMLVKWICQQTQDNGDNYSFRGSTQHPAQEKCHVQISTLLPLAVLPKTLISLWINGDSNDTHQCRAVLRLNEMVKYSVEYCAVLCLVTQSCLTLCDPMDWSLPGSSIHGNSLGKNTGAGCHALCQGILPTQGSKSCLPNCRQILHHLSHYRSPQWNITQS